MVAAIGLSALELQLDLPFGGVVPSGPAGARSLLSSIITAMISFTALVFSITVVALQLASSQYSPRVLRTFLQDRIIQATLGTFVATFLFAMVVLAALPDQEDQRLPELSLAVSIALVLASSATFIYYLHHITTVMRVSHIIGSIGAQTRRSIAGLPPPDEPQVAVLGAVTQTVPASRTRHGQQRRSPPARAAGPRARLRHHRRAHTGRLRRRGSTAAAHPPDRRRHASPGASRRRPNRA